MVTIKDAVIRGKQEDTRGSERPLVVVHKKKAIVISIVPDSHIFWMEILRFVAKDYSELKLEISLEKVITHNIHQKQC